MAEWIPRYIYNAELRKVLGQADEAASDSMKQMHADVRQWTLTTPRGSATVTEPYSSFRGVPDRYQFSIIFERDGRDELIISGSNGSLEAAQQTCVRWLELEKQA